MVRIRSYQNRNIDTSNSSIIYFHYLKQFTLKEFQDRSEFILFLQFLAYAQYRLVEVKVKDFIEYTQENYHHQKVKKFLRFIAKLQKNSLIQFFSDHYYRGLITITIPQVDLFKNPNDKSWRAQIWLANDLFSYLHPFLFKDFFRGKLTKDQFEVLFHLLQIFSLQTSTKGINYRNFITNYSSVLSNSRKTQIKEYFIQYLQILADQKQIQEKVLLLPSQKISQIHQLNSSHLQQNERILIVEFIPIIFQ